MQVTENPIQMSLSKKKIFCTGMQMVQKQPLRAPDIPPAPLDPHHGSASMIFSEFFSCPKLLLPQDLCTCCSCCFAGSSPHHTSGCSSAFLSQHSPPFSVSSLSVPFRTCHSLLYLLQLFACSPSPLCCKLLEDCVCPPCWACSRCSRNRHEINE